MAVSIYCRTTSTDLHLFGESSPGYFSINVSGTTSTRVQSSGSSIRVVAVPTTEGVYCSTFSNLSSGATVTNYGLLSSSTTSTIANTNRATKSTGSGSATVTIIDDHGEHDGTPVCEYEYKKSQVIGVLHTSTNSGYVFDGWKVTFERGSGDSYVQFLSSFTSSEAATSGSITTFTASYSETNAIIVKLGTSTKPVTIEAVYHSTTPTVYTLTYYPNGGSSTPSPVEAKAGAEITLANAITKSGWIFNGWLIDGEIDPRAAGSKYTMPSRDVSATAQWVTSTKTYTLKYNSNGGTPSYSAQTCVTGECITLQGDPTYTNYDFDGWTITDNYGTEYATKQHKDDLFCPVGDYTSLTAKAVWKTRVKHTLTYQTGYEGGTPPSSVSAYAGDQVTLASALSRSGYTFKGWYLSHLSRTVEAGSEFTMPAGDVTAEGRWELKNVTLTYYNGYDGGSYGSQSGTAGTEIILYSSRIRSGYNFIGWLIKDESEHEESSRTYRAGDSYTLRSDATATALWSPFQTYIVSYNRNGNDVVGDDIPSVFVTQGNQTIIRSPSLWNRDGYKFVIWNTNSSGTGTDYKPESVVTPAGNLTLYAIWEQYDTTGSRTDNSYRDNGVTCEVQTFSRTIQGYTMCFSSSVSTQDMTVSGQSATGYVGDHSYGGNRYATHYVTYTRIQATTCKKGDQSRPDTYYNQTPSSSTTKALPIIIAADTPTKDTPDNTLVPIPDSSMQLKTVSVSGSSSHISVTDFSEEIYLNSSSKTFVAPTIDNYDFVGWYGIGHSKTYKEYISSGVKKRDFTMCLSTQQTVTLNILLQANSVCTSYTYTTSYTEYQYMNCVRLVYRGKLCVVLFDAGIGELNSFFKEVRYGELYGDLPTPTAPSGYSFVAWYTASTGGEIVTSTSKVLNATDHVLYARYISSGTLTVTVTFEGMGGTPSQSSKSYTAGSQYTTLPTGTYSGKTFSGWYTEAFDGVKIETSSVVPSYDHTLYARWSTVMYTITLDANGGQVSKDSIQVVKGSPLVSIPRPRRSSYMFKGWFTGKTGGTEVLTSTIPTMDMTIYAHWVESGGGGGGGGGGGSTTVEWGCVRYYGMALHYRGGTLDPSYKKKYDSLEGKILPTSSEITKPNAAFLGWYRDKDCTIGPVYNIPKYTTGKVEFYALWFES